MTDPNPDPNATPPPGPVKMTIDQALAKNAELTALLKDSNTALEQVTKERDQALGVLKAQVRTGLREQVLEVTKLSRPQVDSLTDEEMDAILKHSKLMRGVSKTAKIGVDAGDIENEGLTVGSMFEFGPKKETR